MGHIWGSSYNILKPIFYLLKGNYKSELPGSLARSAEGAEAAEEVGMVNLGATFSSFFVGYLGEALRAMAPRKRKRCFSKDST